MNPRIIFAIFKRNFASYFANPTGYVFICAFVLVSGFAAFWSHAFFNANLANLDQLNSYLPLIMLGFVPAITMSIWADERRQGTDELLLTGPSADVDVVIGKYLAAVSIFSVSLLFSISNIFVLMRLGNPDIGLMFTTYVGYWMVGVAMLAIGMVASFLTSNLTIGFVLGVALNTPLVFMATADVIISGTGFAQNLREWSITAKFADFGRGVISLSSVAYFVAIVAIGLYLSMILIGRRHWLTGGKGGMLGHYIGRGFAVIILAVSLCVIFSVKDVRLDASSEQLSSLAPKTFELLGSLDNKKIQITAYVSPESEVPEGYVQTRLNLLHTLDEIEKSSSGRISVRVYDQVEGFKEEATVANQLYGIQARNVFSQNRGKFKQHEIFMGVALTSGLDKEVIPFVDRGLPIEYELIRSIIALSSKQSADLFTADAKFKATLDTKTIANDLRSEFKSKNIELPAKVNLDVVTDGSRWAFDHEGHRYSLAAKQKGDEEVIAISRQQKLKNLGIVRTDAPLFGSLDQRTMQPSEDEQFVTELRKQYKVSEVDASRKIEGKFDVLLVVQPSSLDNNGLKNVIDAIRSGQPTAIFEDPTPVIFRGRVPGTSEPKQAPMTRRGMGPPPTAKADLRPLWDLLGVHFSRRFHRMDTSQPDKPMGTDVYINGSTELATFEKKDAATGRNNTSLGMVTVDYKSGQPIVYYGSLMSAPSMGGPPSPPTIDDLVVVSQNYNPFPKISDFPNEFIFIGNGSGVDDAINQEDAITSGLQNLMLLGAGYIKGIDGSSMTVSPLLQTGEVTALVKTSDMFTRNMFGQEQLNDNAPRQPSYEQFTTAARINGQPKGSAQSINVVLIADIDMIASAFFNVRNQGENEVMGAYLDVDNVPFIFNVIDTLADDSRFVDIRKRKRIHRTLTAFEQGAEDVRLQTEKASDEFAKEFKDAIEAEETKINDRLEELAKQRMKNVIDDRQYSIKRQAAEEQLQKSLTVKRERLVRERDQALEKAKSNLELEIRRMQNREKRLAVFMPPILPLAIGIGVFFWRRSRELEGAVKSRIR